MLKTLSKGLILGLCIASIGRVEAQTDSAKVAAPTTTVTTQPTTSTSSPAPTTEKKKAWYDKIEFGGYVHMRYNRFLETNGQLKCEQCDRSIGDGGGVFFRRARLKFSGYIHDRVYIYIQGDVAQNASTGAVVQQNFYQLRDFYTDLYLNKSKTLRTRIGLSKVPFGFENMQSSQKRIAFDRGDALNSSIYNERDMGIFLYYTPTKVKERFKYIDDNNLRHSGDYGMIGFGFYNGQTMNRQELNNNPHTVGRITYPFALGDKQILELGVQGYFGWFNVGEAMTPVTVTTTGNKHGKDFWDQRVAASMILYPQPFGIQAEYMYGYGPVFKYDGGTSYRIIEGVNEGGYVQLTYLKKVKSMTFIPYVKGQYFYGGKKVERDARRTIVKEVEFGVEWQVVKALELTFAYTMSDRTFEDSGKPVNHQVGNFARIQVQINY
ncbi:MAG: porin [Cytophagaceae bacterium]